MSDYDSVLAAAFALPGPQRLQLIEALQETVADEFPLSDEWLSEIERRSAEFDAGHARTIPWEQVRAERNRA